ncbi:MAG: PAS domain-containing sensor histidine kinase, partial [Methylococcales bacterium]
MTTQHIDTSEKTAQLTDAFRIFNELSQHLSASYQNLEEQVSKLHQELAFAHSERLKSLEEKEILASRLEKIVAALPAGVVVVDEGGRIVESNAIALTFLSAPLLGELWTNVAMRSLKPVFANPHEHLVADGVRV